VVKLWPLVAIVVFGRCHFVHYIGRDPRDSEELWLDTL
jgi:hypothetical protein